MKKLVITKHVSVEEWDFSQQGSYYYESKKTESVNTFYLIKIDYRHYVWVNLQNLELAAHDITPSQATVENAVEHILQKENVTLYHYNASAEIGEKYTVIRPHLPIETVKIADWVKADAALHYIPPESYIIHDDKCGNISLMRAAEDRLFEWTALKGDSLSHVSSFRNALSSAAKSKGAVYLLENFSEFATYLNENK